jgi:hypothetical protein
VTIHHTYRPSGPRARENAVWLRSSLRKVFIVDETTEFGHLIARLDRAAEAGAQRG